MLYTSLSQPTIFLWLCVGGFFAGAIFDAKNMLAALFNKNKIISQILLFFCCFFALFVLFYVNLKVNYGSFRFFVLVAFALAFAIERFLSVNFLAKPFAKCYNKLNEKRRNRKSKPNKTKI